VSALGWSGIVPWDTPSYHKIEIGPHVRNAYHAVALDEVQSSFRAQLWDTKAIIRNGTLHCEQLWFAGGHGDVGGGHPDAKEDPTALARVPLLWMMERANEVALAEPEAKATPLLRPEALEELRKADYLAPQHSLPPNIGPIAGALMRDVPRQVPSQDRMHQAAADRIGKLVEVRSSDGEPEGPKVHYRPVASYTGEA
jgi:hypothetical protein